MQVVITFNWKGDESKMKVVSLSRSSSIDDCCVSMATFAEFAFTSIIVITLIITTYYYYDLFVVDGRIVLIRIIIVIDIRIIIVVGIAIFIIVMLIFIF